MIRHDRHTVAPVITFDEVRVTIADVPVWNSMTEFSVNRATMQTSLQIDCVVPTAEDKPAALRTLILF